MSHKKSKLHFSVVLILLSCWAHAGEMAKSTSTKTAARVVRLSGQVWTSYGTAPKVALNVDDKIFEGASLITGEAASVEIMLSDHSILKLGAQSKIELPFSGSEPDHVSVMLNQGVVKAIVKKQIGGKRSFSVKTQSATMGVRGTEFIVEVLIDSHVEEVLVINGDVEVMDNQGKTMALVEAGMGYIAHSPLPNGTSFHSSAPQRLASAQIEAMKNERFLTSPGLLTSLQLSPVNGEAAPVSQGALVKNPPQPPLPANPGSVQPALPGGAPGGSSSTSGGPGVIPVGPPKKSHMSPPASQ